MDFSHYFFLVGIEIKLHCILMTTFNALEWNYAHIQKLATANRQGNDYRNLPNKGAGRSSKVKSDILGKRLRSSAFQWWFRIENRTIIKETMPILAIFDSIGFLQTRGAPLLGEAPLIGRIRYIKGWKRKCLKNRIRSVRIPIGLKSHFSLIK